MKKWAIAALMAAQAVSAGARGEADGAASLEALRAQDLRVAQVGFRMATAGLPLCATRARQAGLVLHDAAQYGGELRPIAIRHFGFGPGPSLSAVVPGGPADKAGLRADDALIAINGDRLDGAPAGRNASYDAMARSMAMLEAALARGPVRFTVKRGERTFDVMVDPVTACASEVQLITSRSMDAMADGNYVQVTSAMVAYVRTDDELAVLIGHELAHNILGHRARLDAQGVGTGLSSRFGRQAAKIRATEIEADRLGLRLMGLAGYDLAAAPAFWRRFGKEHGPGIFADATHPSWRKREEMLSEAIVEMREEERGRAAP